MMDPALDLKDDELLRIIYHVFLPRKLPGREAPSLVHDEENILMLFTSVITSSQYSPHIPKATRKLFEIWNVTQREQSPRNIATSLRTLKDGMFGYYIRAQNSGILIHIDASENTTLSTFPASLKSDLIMSTCTGEVVSSFPEQCIKIKKSDLLCSEAVARQIVTLTNEGMTESSPTSRKAGVEAVEVREVCDTTYVSGWLTSLLSSAESRIATEKELPRICKKVRDSVVWDHSLIPFRRSGLWMTAKVMLQLSLIKYERTPGEGIFLYKLLLAEFLQEICKACIATQVDADIGMHMIKKLARRVRKIQALNVKIPSFMNKLLEDSTQTCKDIKIQLVNYQNSITAQVILPKLEINKMDIIHPQLPIVPRIPSMRSISTKYNPTFPPRIILSCHQIPHIKLLLSNAPQSRENIGIILFEAESWILQYLDSYVAQFDNPDPTPIRAFAISYADIAPNYYEGNPVGMSRMILAYLKIIQVVDSIAYKSCQVFQEHKSGINADVICQLLLPLRSDMEMAHKLELYFITRNNESYPGLTEEYETTRNSFSVRFGEQDTAICELRDRILLDAEHAILGKLGELKHARKVCEELRQKIRNSTCNCGGLKITSQCGYHSKLETIKEQYVTVYERPLRPEKWNQIAAVFELLIPKEIACVRDIVILFYSKMCRNEAKPYQIKGIWTNYEQLSKYNDGEERSLYFKLGSTTKLFVDSHYSRAHPDEEDSHFIVNNAYNCIFEGNYEKLVDVKEFCTLIVTPNTLYSSLQWTLETTRHTQNEVLAKQVDCPGKLRLVEYKEFGSLRAGHRLQLRNILRSMVERSLSFREESVFALICQAVWEAEKRLKNSWHRESHEDLANPDFTAEWINELDKQLNSYQDNWDDPYTIQIITVLACRALEFGIAPTIAIKLVLKCRKTAFDWISRIEKMVTESSDCSADHVQKLKLKLVDACVCVCWTYYVSAEYLNLVLNCDEDLFHWSHAMTRIQHTITPSTTLSGTKRMLIDIVRRNIALTIQTNLGAFINGLNQFAQQNWNEGPHGTFTRWKPYKNHPSTSHIFHSTFQREESTATVHLLIDILRGTFLVNGLPVGWLPEAITNHPTFSRTFQDVVFEVYPAVEESTLVSKHQYQNADYRFTLLDDEQKTLIIRQRKTMTTLNANGGVENTTVAFQLIPPKLLDNLIPPLLIENFSHWLNLKEHVIEFRPVKFTNFEREKPKLLFSTQNRILLEVATGNKFFSYRSATQASVSKYLARLEDSKYVHSLLAPDGNIRVELPRMQLTFDLNENTFHLINKEHGLEVSPSQNLGTLTGLDNGLLLENEHGDRKLLVPHGEVQIKSKYSRGHPQVVEVILGNLKTPPIFAFDVNDRLQQLRANNSQTAWLYLAYIHALTSSPLADSFTNVTGTESALQILQSALCWSCKPYENQESLNILEKIKALAPIRLYYPPDLTSMETVSWPQGLPSCAAHDGYRFVVDKLIQDSSRISALFVKIDHARDKTMKKKDTDYTLENLARRDYIRYEPLLSVEAKVLSQYIDITANRSNTKPAGKSWRTRDSLLNTRTISELGHSWQFRRPSSVNITNLLIADEDLQGLTDPTQLTQLSIVELQKLDLRQSWINLYELARLVKPQELKSEWTTLLSILAFRGLDIHQLLILQGVAVHRMFFQAQKPPDVEFFQKPSSFYNDAVARNIFTAQGISFGSVGTFVTLLDVLWPIKSLSVANFEDLASANNSHNMVVAINKLNRELVHWYRSAELKSFLEKIEKTMLVLATCSTCLDLSIFAQESTDVVVKSLDNFRVKVPFRMELNSICKTQHLEVSTVPHIIGRKRLLHAQVDPIADAKEIFENGLILPPLCELKNEELLNYLQELHQFIKEKLEKYRNIITTCIVHPETEGLLQSDLIRLNPTSLLKNLLRPENLMPKFNETLFNLIGAYGVLFTLEQRASRCIRYHKMGNAGMVQLMREQENEGHTNWSPAEMPEWLLFEIESNLMIRPVQIDVARQMISPPGGKHSVMQLNMGEGKTAVIVPLLALALSNGKQVVRATVLKSLFKTNMTSLTFSLGSLLNRRIYTFPCQRDLDIDGATASTMKLLYSEALTLRGVIMTIPEHRLSFQLKGYEMCHSGYIEDAKPLLTLRNWIGQNVRDILDESDEILHVKYQLIYTLGSPLAVDGCALRWTVAQSLLKLIQQRIIDLQNAFGNSCVDATSWDPQKPEIFHHTRILKKECYNQLCVWIASDILDHKSPGIKIPELLPGKRDLLMDLLTNTEISEDRHNQAMQLLISTQETSILILMGYLKYEILYIVLNKRWRVNYGVDVEGDRKMAVPFRAKDVPAKRTEFGHPDVAILLTQLSYYYSGLSDSELEECFVALNFTTNKEEEYASWIRGVNLPDDVSASIKHYTGVNLADIKQKNDLFPILHKNMAVVDFYLGKIVFPKESRTFEHKLVCTAWDLCSEDFALPVTGFSGTNDSSNLLPAPIIQQDLPQLQNTNDKMRKTILLPENNNVNLLPRGTTSVQILEELIHSDIPILLDSGALMMELDNEEVARTWLELLKNNETTNKEAAVYYDNQNELRVKDINYLEDSIPFHTSSFVDKLDRCVIYLDDIHTRGTDLKIPPPSRACVTISAGITRDKMVQACMRMRLLGKGHSIHFLVNDEAYNGILTYRVNPTSKLSTKHLMKWVCNNSSQFEKDGLVYWATSGINYYHKRAVEDTFCVMSSTPSELNFGQYASIGTMCTDQDFQTLKAMFGQHRHEINYMEVLTSQIAAKKADILKQFSAQSMEMLKKRPIFANFGNPVLNRCQTFISGKTVVSHLLDEEQEKEHEEEPEQEEEIRRPPAATPAKHSLHEQVVHFTTQGDIIPGLLSGAILSFYQAMPQTTMWEHLPPNENWCIENIFVTQDFVSVVISRNPNDKLNEFIRTPNWIVSYQNQNPSKTILLLVSPFEANELIQIIKGLNNGVRLRIFAPRLIPQQSTLMDSQRLLLPNIPDLVLPPIPTRLLPPLFILSGTLYFLTEDEIESYCRFTGMIPYNNRSRREIEAFRSGKIDRGFLLEPFRKDVSPKIAEMCRFTKHPEVLIRQIIETRHGYFPQSSHVSILMLDCLKVKNFAK